MTRDELNWRDDAACQGIPTAGHDPWFPSMGRHPDADEAADSYRPARRICRACPVSAHCLAEAMAHEGSIHTSGRHGMFGGLSPEERYRLYRKGHPEDRRRVSTLTLPADEELAS